MSDFTLVAKTVSLPLPPSTNNLFATKVRRVRGKLKLGRFPAKRYAEWRDAAGWTLKSQQAWRISGAINVMIMLPESMRGDIDNRIKAILDLLVTYDRIDDDKNVHSLHVTRSPAVTERECRIYVEALAGARPVEVRAA